MERETIIQMACEAGACKDGPKLWLMYIEDLERFAQLVASAVRKATLEEMIYAHPTTAIKQAVEYEREACAQICEQYSDTDTYQGGITTEFHAIMIRKRGETNESQGRI